MSKEREKGLTALLIIYAIIVATILIGGCATLRTTNASACLVPFDYEDTGANEQNKRAMLAFYCICVDESPCK